MRSIGNLSARGEICKEAKGTGQIKSRLRVMVRKRVVEWRLWMSESESDRVWRQ